MTDTPTRSPSELADALEARASEHDRGDLSDTSTALLRAAAARLRSDAARIRVMEEALEPFAECANDMLIDRYGLSDPVAFRTVGGKASVSYSHFAAARTARGES